MFIAKTDTWYLERIIWLVAGSIIIISTVLTLLVNTYWIILTIFAGVGLIIFALTGFCLMANILVKAGFNPRCDG